MAMQPRKCVGHLTCVNVLTESGLWPMARGPWPVAHGPWRGPSFTFWPPFVNDFDTPDYSIQGLSEAVKLKKKKKCSLRLGQSQVSANRGGLSCFECVIFFSAPAVGLNSHLDS